MSIKYEITLNFTVCYFYPFSVTIFTIFMQVICIKFTLLFLLNFLKINLNHLMFYFFTFLTIFFTKLLCSLSMKKLTTKEDFHGGTVQPVI